MNNSHVETQKTGIRFFFSIVRHTQKQSCLSGIVLWMAACSLHDYFQASDVTLIKSAGSLTKTRSR